MKKIKIMIDATILKNACHKGAGRSGIFWTALELTHAFKKREDVRLYFYCKAQDYPELKKAISQNLQEFKKIPIFSYNDNYYFFKNFSLLNTLSPSFYKTYWFFVFLIRKVRASLFQKKSTLPDIDVFFSPFEMIPLYIESYPNIEKRIVIHDTIPLLLTDYFKDMKNSSSWFLGLVAYMKKHTETKYFANSMATKNDFLKFLPNLKPEQITTTPLACAKRFHPCTKSETQKSLQKYHLNPQQKYIFSLCSLEPRKNLIRAVKTFVQFIKKNNIDDLIFVLGGGHWDDFIGQLNQEISDLNEYQSKIVKAGYIDDEDLAPLYSGAEWFVYTSQYEGFGLPPLEAMACGCPVITSNNSSLPEVVSDAGITIDWDSDEQHIEAYENYYYHPELKAKMSEKGLKRAQEFSWDKTADLMVDEMKQSIAQKSENQFQRNKK